MSTKPKEETPNPLTAAMAAAPIERATLMASLGYVQDPGDPRHWALAAYIPKLRANGQWGSPTSSTASGESRARLPFLAPFTAAEREQIARARGWSEESVAAYERFCPKRPQAVEAAAGALTEREIKWCAKNGFTPEQYAAKKNGGRTKWGP